MKQPADIVMECRGILHYYTLTDLQNLYHIDPDAMWQVRKTAAMFQLYGLIFGILIGGTAVYFLK